MKTTGRRKVLSVLLTLAMLCSLMVTTAFASSASDSTTTLYGSANDAESGTYVIYDQDDMDAFVSYVNAGRNTAGVTFVISGTGNTYNVTSVIAAPTTVSSYSTNSPYISSGAGFRGTFDGENNTINVTLNTSVSGTGLFGYLAPGGKVQNLNVSGSVTVSGSHDAIGGVVGYNSGIIDKVTSTVVVTANSAYNVGGIAGFNDNYYMAGAVGTIRNCCNNGTVSGSSKVGGIAGENAGLIASCYNTAAISDPNSGKNGVGGIAGRNGNNNTAVETGVIRDCYNTANITCSNGKWVGGITGFLNSKSSCVNCYDTGNLTAVSYVDPITGKKEGTVTNCYYKSGVTTVEGYDTSIAKDESYMLTTAFGDLLNGSPSSGCWTQTTGSYPALAGGYSEVTTPATGVSGTTPTLETDGVILGGSSSGAYTSLPAAITAAASTTSKTVYVAGETALSGTIAGTTGVTIKRSVTYDGILFTISDGATVALSNMTVDGNGTVGTNLIRVYGGSLTLDSTVTLQNASSNANGGAVHVQGGTVSSAATVSNCSARNGGGYFISGGSLTLTGGSISGCSNQTAGKAAGVYVSTGTTFTLNASSLTIGNVIYLESGAYITVAQAIPSDLTVESAVTDSDTVIVAGANTYTLQDSDAEHISLSTGDRLSLEGNQIVISE